MPSASTRSCRSVQQDLEDLDRLRDVLDVLCAQVLEAHLDLGFNLVKDVARHADAARLGQPFQARRDVDPIAIDVITFDDDVTDVDTDTEGDPPIFGHVGVAFGYGPLDIDGEVDGSHDAAELHQSAVADQFDDAPVVRGGLGLE